MNMLDLLTSLDHRPFVRQIILQYVLFMLIYIVMRIGYLLLQRRRLELVDEVRYFVGMGYLTAVLALTLTPLAFNFDLRGMVPRIQLVPFDTVTRYWPLEGEYSIYNIVGNFLMMFPMFPVLTYCFRVGSVKETAVFTAFFIVGIETMQLVLTATRACDIDDFILNFGGFIVSIYVWKFILRMWKYKRKMKLGELRRQ